MFTGQHTVTSPGPVGPATIQSPGQHRPLQNNSEVAPADGLELVSHLLTTNKLGAALRCDPDCREVRGRSVRPGLMTPYHHPHAPVARGSASADAIHYIMQDRSLRTKLEGWHDPNSAVHVSSKTLLAQLLA